MAISFHHFDKWCFANIDLAEEVLETQNKAVIIIAGASSSGKSFSAEALKRTLNAHGHRATIISLDQYNFGLSAIIPNKVNENVFHGSIANIEEIEKVIKPILLDFSFQDKYCERCLSRIKKAIAPLLEASKIPQFIGGLAKEWKLLNFDEPTVYHLKEAALDVKKLLDEGKIQEKKYSKIVSERVRSWRKIDGKKFDVIIVEGIYALDKTFLDELQGIQTITNFIDGNAKSLFLRRIIRDKVSTSADTPFTTHLYFRYIIPSYKNTILPTRENADVILDNNMSFEELRSGELYVTKDGFTISNPKAASYLLSHSEIKKRHYEKDYYFIAPLESKNSDNILRFRLRSKDEGKTYEPGSLVHKGAPKVRKDNKIIRPINVLLNEEEIKAVWSDEASCLNDFKKADFLIEKVETKIKSKIVYKGQNLTLFEVDKKGAYVEIVPPILIDVVKEIKHIIK
mgnify:FL=1